MAPKPFQVQVSEQELVYPEKPTPHESKFLSNIDDQLGLRNHIPFVHFYPRHKHLQDPILMIRKALARVLVYYYPVAGRLRSGENGKLIVDCCSEGVVFRGATARITLAELRGMSGGELMPELRGMSGGELMPPFPQWHKLLVDDIWGSNFITDSPLLHMQVTRLACGGLVLAYTFNHCICDAYGAYQFITALSEFCKNPQQNAPTSLPSWGREALRPRSPPIVAYPHPEYEKDYHPGNTYTEEHFKSLAQTSIFFSREDIRKLQNKIPGHKCPTFDLISACLWRARTQTLMTPKSLTRLIFPVDTRLRHKPYLPKGYYGSAVVFPCAETTSAELTQRPLSYAASLVSKVKKQTLEDEYRASVLDFIEVNGRKGFRSDGSFVVSDMSRVKFAEVDFGWGHGVYGGPARAGTGLTPGMVTSVIGYKNKQGDEGLLALISLPPESVERFHKEVKKEINSAFLQSVSSL